MDLIKQTSIFHPEVLLGGTVTIIGCGALGSALALQIVRLGVPRINLIDDDRVEAHNIANQVAYTEADIGRHKAVALAEKLFAASPRLSLGVGLFRWGETSREAEISEDWAKHLAKNRHGAARNLHVVLVCVDSMLARSAILNSLEYDPTARYVIEGRMGARDGSAYAINLQESAQLKEYKNFLYTDDEVVHEKAACGTILSIGATASIISSIMTWLFIQHLNAHKEAPNEVAISTSTWTMLSNKF